MCITTWMSRRVVWHDARLFQDSLKNRSWFIEQSPEIHWTIVRNSLNYHSSSWMVFSARYGRPLACSRVQFPEYGRKFPNAMRNGRKWGQSGWNGFVRGWSFRNMAGDFRTRRAMAGNGANPGGKGLFAGAVSRIRPEISELDAQWPEMGPGRVEFPEYGRKFPRPRRDERG